MRISANQVNKMMAYITTQHTHIARSIYITLYDLCLTSTAIQVYTAHAVQCQVKSDVNHETIYFVIELHRIY